LNAHVEQTNREELNEYFKIYHLVKRTTTALVPFTNPLWGSMDFVNITYHEYEYECESHFKSYESSILAGRGQVERITVTDSRV
jgi:hypothetical protein